MDAHDVLHGHGQHAEGVVIPDVVLGGEGDVLDVRQGFYLIPTGDAGLAQALVVEGDVVVAVVHHPLEAPQLQGFNIRPLHGFYVFLEKPGFHWCSDLPSRGSPGGFGRFGFVLVNRESALVYCTGNDADLQVFLHKGDRALFSFGEGRCAGGSAFLWYDAKLSQGGRLASSPRCPRASMPGRCKWPGRHFPRTYAGLSQ